MDAVVGLFAAFAVQLFIIVDPIAGLPVFLGITPANTSAERRVMVRRGCLAAFGVLVFFLCFGRLIMNYFGIETEAVRICGGILLFAISLEMLSGRLSRTETSHREEQWAEAKDDISLTPLAFPLLAGPGAIATCLIFSARADSVMDYLALLAGIALVLGLSYLVLLQAESLLRLLGALGTVLLTRLMGLLLSFLAVQYVVDGVRTAFGL